MLLTQTLSQINAFIKLSKATRFATCMIWQRLYDLINAKLYNPKKYQKK